MSKIAERLREGAAKDARTSSELWCVLKRELSGSGCNELDTCHTCMTDTLHAIADAIESEQAANPSKSRELPEGIEWPRFEDGGLVKMGDGVEGLDGPADGFSVYDDGSWCVMHDGDAFYGNAHTHAVRKAPEVLDADGVPVKVGDTVYGLRFGACRGEVKSVHCAGEQLPFPGATRRPDSPFAVFDKGGGKEGWDFANQLTHRKPDTMEAIDADVEKTACEYFDGAERVNCHGCKSPKAPKSKDGDAMYSACREEQVRDLLKRQRELLGGAR